MTPTPRRVGLVLTALAVTLAGCTGPGPLDAPKVAPAGPYQLVAFDSCAPLLDQVRAAAKASVQAGRLIRPLPMDGAAENMARDDAAKAPTGDGSAGYSGTNNHEAGVEEPDTVKTDGRRIVTVSQGVLRVVDPASRRVTGTLDLARLPGVATTAPEPEMMRWQPANLLLAGDRALVLTAGTGLGSAAGRDLAQAPPSGTVRALLVDLTGNPRLVSSYRVEGELVDARQVGTTARLVVRGSPRLDVPWRDGQTEAERLADLRKLVDRAPIERWLPRYEIVTGDRVESGHVECDEMRLPEAYSGLQTLTLASLDLAADGLDRGDPLTLVADGHTVYGTATSLYVATDERWRLMDANARTGGATPAKPATTVYRFDTSGAVPVYSGGGRVPGYLLNQYALSEWDGTLRVATTTGEPWAPRDDAPRTESAVYALRLADGQLKQVGHVGGLGKGERIFGVRFAGPIGYVVTFRQVDPLYTVDLSDPARPVVRGELKVDGYSAYLHPLDATRLLGVGQDVRDGRTRGTQVAVFDVSDLGKPRRVSRLTITDSYSDAEHDPHAFLYWPANGTVVVPTSNYARAAGPPGASAVVLRVAGGDLRTVGSLNHPVRAQITRSLVVDGVLWTVSQAGVQANDLDTLARRAWLPYD